MEDTGLVFELQALKGEIKRVLTGCTVAKVTSDVMKIATTCLATIGNFLISLL